QRSRASLQACLNASSATFPDICNASANGTVSASSDVSGSSVPLDLERADKRLLLEDADLASLSGRTSVIRSSTAITLLQVIQVNVLELGSSSWRICSRE